MEFDINNSRDLLLVKDEGKIYVVDAPAHEAVVGDMVDFAFGNSVRTGKVVDKMWCMKDEDTYRCVSQLHNIYPAKKIFKAMWTAEETKHT